MVVDTPGYDSLILYLTENLSLFEKPSSLPADAETVAEFLEACFTDHIMRVCQQHEMTETQRFAIIRESDAVLLDLLEVLSSVAKRPVTPEQKTFLTEYVGLIKNLFDSTLP